MRYKHLHHEGYIVFRHFEEFGDVNVCIALAFRVATFVTEAEAVDYCKYRNNETARNNSDSVLLIRHKDL